MPGWGGGFNVSRSWEWNPKTDSVSYEGKDKDGKPVRVTYQRSQATGVPEDIDANFLNDRNGSTAPRSAAARS